ncbi:hypothetical protein cypCar_00035923 [Cyprinus carpio]|nr:hypothetical protein cypCar_00035923 [Cyprinus carpio]
MTVDLSLVDGSEDCVYFAGNSPGLQPKNTTKIHGRGAGEMGHNYAAESQIQLRGPEVTDSMQQTGLVGTQSEDQVPHEQRYENPAGISVTDTNTKKISSRSGGSTLILFR